MANGGQADEGELLSMKQEMRRKMHAPVGVVGQWLKRVVEGYYRWDRLRPIFERWIPRPRILHPYPDVRFDATHPR